MTVSQVSDEPHLASKSRGDWAARSGAVGRGTCLRRQLCPVRSERARDQPLAREGENWLIGWGTDTKLNQLLEVFNRLVHSNVQSDSHA